MKKLKTVVTSMMLMLFSFAIIISCNENDATEMSHNNPAAENSPKTMARMSEENLSIALSEDVDFRALSDMIVFFEKMPDKENFVANFNKETLESQENDDYFISLSGYTQQDVTNAKTKVINHTEQMFLKFPQLKEYNQTDLYNIIESASDLYYNSLNLGSKIKCSTCGKIGRAKMIFYTATGAATCSVGGFYAAWACGVAGFALAGYEALGCLEDCQK